MAKIGRWDESSLDRALRHVDADDVNALQMLRHLLHHDPNQRYNTLREALEHPFFNGSSEDRVLKKREGGDTRSTSTKQQGHASTNATMNTSRNVRKAVVKNGISEGLRYLDQENSANGVSVSRSAKNKNSKKVKGCDESVASGKSRASIMSFKKMKGLRERMRGRGQI